MNIVTAPVENRPVWVDRLIWLLVIIVFAGALVANYYFVQIPAPIRVAAWIVLACVMLLLLAQTSAGKRCWRFAKEARTEIVRVVWPTRQETLQTTGVVFLMVVVLAVILWAVDSVLLWAISTITGHGG